MDATNSAEIKTEFDNLAYVPGERIRGTVSWRLSSVPKAAALRLFYYTEGKGTQDVEIVEDFGFDAPTATEEREFDFELPQGPYSFSGKLISLIWALELEIIDDGPVERLIFTLSPTGEEVNLYRHAHEDMPDYGVLRFGKKKTQGNSLRDRLANE